MGIADWKLKIGDLSHEHLRSGHSATPGASFPGSFAGGLPGGPSIAQRLQAVERQLYAQEASMGQHPAVSPQSLYDEMMTGHRK